MIFEVQHVIQFSPLHISENQFKNMAKIVLKTSNLIHYFLNSVLYLYLTQTQKEYQISKLFYYEFTRKKYIYHKF